MRTSFGARATLIKGFNGIVDTPRINWQHPLAKKILFAVDLASGTELTGKGLGAVTGTRPWAPTLGGRMRGFGPTYGVGATDSVASSLTSPVGGPRSYLCTFFPKSSGPSGAGTLWVKSDPSDNPCELVRIALNADDFSNITYSISLARNSGGHVAAPLGTYTDPLIFKRPYAVVFTTDGVSNTTARAFVNGSATPYRSPAAVGGGAESSTTPYRFGNTEAGNRAWDGWLGIMVCFACLLTPAEAQQLSANPAALICGTPYFPFTAPTASIYRPGSDIAAASWTASAGSDLFACIDETALDRGDHITSPEIPGAGSYVAGLTASLPVGTWAVEVDAKYIDGAAQLRVHLQDAGGTDVGVSSWQSLTGSDATYTLTITTTGVATRMSIEVQ